MEHRQLSVEEALTLSDGFRSAAVAIGDYLYDKQRWPNLPEQERTRLASLVVTLFNLASDLIIEAGMIVLKNAGKTLAELNGATALAHNAIGRISHIGAALTLTTALIGLAAAIPTGNMAAILGAALGVREAAAAGADGPALAIRDDSTDHASDRPG